jgi:hypothetical protein
VRTWLRDSRWALIALVVFIPGAIVTSMTISWFDYQNRLNLDAVEVAEGDTGEYLGSEFTLRDVEFIDWDSDEGELYDVHEGGVLVVATVEVDPRGEVADDYVSCVLELHGDDGRIWEIANSDDTTFFPDSPAVGYCDVNQSEPFELAAAFVIPDDARDRVSLVVLDPAEAPRALRLAW